MKNIFKIAIVPCCLAGLYQGGASASEPLNAFTERSHHRLNLQENPTDVRGGIASFSTSREGKKLEKFWVDKDYNIYREFKNNLLGVLKTINQAENFNDLKSSLSKGRNIEHLRGQSSRQEKLYSIRINDGYRLCFNWDQNNNKATNLWFGNYH